MNSGTCGAPAGKFPVAHRGRHGQQRAFAMILVLMLLIVFAVFAGIATMFLRPAATNLDMHHEATRARLLAESALQEALARHAAGGPADFEMSSSPRTDETEGAVAKRSGDAEVDITATGTVRTLEGERAQCTSAATRVRLRKTAGAWHVVDYSPAPARRKQE